MTTHREHLPKTHGPLVTPERLAAIGWGAFFIWVGVALALSLGFGVTLVGIGVLTLAVQVIRSAADLPVEGFWIGAGVFFLAAGLWPLLNVGIPFVPAVLLAIGVLIVAGGLGKKHDKNGRVY